MKDFFKFTLATMVGLILATIAMFFISMLLIFSMAFSAESETKVEENSVMTLELSGTLNERNVEIPFSHLMGSDFNSYGLDDILASIKKAKENDRIKGIYLKPTALVTGFASLQEIRDALADFKTSGKFIVAYADIYTQGLYYLSSVADKVLLNPSGSIDWRGLAANPVYYKDLLDKIGIEMQVFKVGTYKSAVEPVLSNQMSDANREQISVYLQSIWSEMRKAVAEGRNLSPEKVDQLADSAMVMRPATDLVAQGLADTLIYKSDVKEYLKQMMDLDEDDDLHTLNLHAMINVKKNTPKDKSGNVIAIYYAAGEIDDSSSSAYNMEGIHSNEVVRDLRKLEKNEDVKAVVLRVNSPGGSAYGSEQIWHAVSQLKAKKPVIVSMGDYAASGGYYISCNADTIVAEPTTLTGSIGIFGLYPNTQKLMNDKLGIHVGSVKTHRLSDFGEPSRPLSQEERALLQQRVVNGYDLFLTRCADGRGMTKEELDKIAQGRVWTGTDAKELGLVDVLGGIDTALEIAITKAGVSAYTVMGYPDKESFFDMLMDGSMTTGLARNCLLRGRIGQLMEKCRFVEQLDKADPIQARIPYELVIQ